MERLKISFEGTIRDFDGILARRTHWQAIKTGLKVWGIFWLFGLVFIFVPYVNISVFMIFVPLGPVAMGIIYFASKKVIQSIQGRTECARCGQEILISETNVTPPIYEHCPHCRCSFEILVPDPI